MRFSPYNDSISKTLITCEFALQKWQQQNRVKTQQTGIKADLEGKKKNENEAIVMSVRRSMQMLYTRLSSEDQVNFNVLQINKNHILTT